MSTAVCVCGSNALVHYEGQSDPQPKACQRHRLQQVLRVGFESAPTRRELRPHELHCVSLDDELSP